MTKCAWWLVIAMARQVQDNGKNQWKISDETRQEKEKQNKNKKINKYKVGNQTKRSKADNCKVGKWITP